MELATEELVKVTVLNDATGICENPALSSLNSTLFPLLVLVMVLLMMVLHIVMLTASV